MYCLVVEFPLCLHSVHEPHRRGEQWSWNHAAILRGINMSEKIKGGEPDSEDGVICSIQYFRTASATVVADIFRPDIVVQGARILLVQNSKLLR